MPPGVIGIDFFVIGAMKAATTGMCEWLDTQDGISLSHPKEPSVFVSDASVASWTPRIDDLYEDAGPDDVRGEGSTDYAKFPAVAGVPGLVHAHAPDARFIYMMRHPVDRAISQYRFEWLLGAKTMPFDQALAANPGLLDNGRYALQLQQWLEYFSPDRFLLVFSEAFARDPQAQVRRALQFLGRAGQTVAPHGEERPNDTTTIVRRTLARRILRDSRLGRAIRPLVPEAIATTHRNREQARSRPDLSDDVRRAMIAAFDEDLSTLSALTGGPTITCANWQDLATTWTPALSSS